MEIMRIGLFSDYYFSKGDGTAIATRLSEKGLARRGHQVFIFSPSVPGEPSRRGVRTFRSIPGLLYPGLRLCWPFSRRNLIELAQLKLDIIHVETPLFAGLFGLWAARRLKIRSVITIHLDMDFMAEYIVRLPALAFLVVLTACITGDLKFMKTFWPRRTDKSKRRSEDFAWRCMAYTASKADFIISPSQKNYEQLIKYLNPSKVGIVPNGIDAPSRLPDKSLARQKLGLKPEELVIISTARHVKEKQIDKIIESFALANLPMAKLLVLNKGPLTPNLQQLAVELGVERKVTFHGLQTRQKVFELLAASDVFVNASEREVASLGVLEAAATGLPLLLFDNRLVEPLGQGENGYFVSGTKTLRMRLLELAKDPAKRRQLGENSARRAKNYSLAVHVKSLEKTYRDIINRPD